MLATYFVGGFVGFILYFGYLLLHRLIQTIRQKYSGLTSKKKRRLGFLTQYEIKRDPSDNEPEALNGRALDALRGLQELPYLRWLPPNWLTFTGLALVFLYLLFELTQLTFRLVFDPFGILPDPSRNYYGTSDVAAVHFWLGISSGFLLGMLATKINSTQQSEPYLVKLLFISIGSVFLFATLLPHIERLASNANVFCMAGVEIQAELINTVRAPLAADKSFNRQELSEANLSRMFKQFKSAEGMYRKFPSDARICMLRQLAHGRLGDRTYCVKYLNAMENFKHFYQDHLWSLLNLIDTAIDRGDDLSSIRKMVSPTAQWLSKALTMNDSAPPSLTDSSSPLPSGTSPDHAESAAPCSPDSKIAYDDEHASEALRKAMKLYSNDEEFPGVPKFNLSRIDICHFERTNPLLAKGGMNDYELPHIVLAALQQFMGDNMASILTLTRADETFPASLYTSYYLGFAWTVEGIAPRIAYEYSKKLNQDLISLMGGFYTEGSWRMNLNRHEFVPDHLRGVCHFPTNSDGKPIVGLPSELAKTAETRDKGHSGVPPGFNLLRIDNHSVFFEPRDVMSDAYRIGSMMAIAKTSMLSNLADAILIEGTAISAELSQDLENAIEEGRCAVRYLYTEKNDFYLKIAQQNLAHGVTVSASLTGDPKAMSSVRRAEFECGAKLLDTLFKAKMSELDSAITSCSTFPGSPSQKFLLKPQCSDLRMSIAESRYLIESIHKRRNAMNNIGPRFGNPNNCMRPALLKFETGLAVDS